MPRPPTRHSLETRPARTLDGDQHFSGGEDMGDRIDRSGIEDERDERTGRNAASERIRNQARAR